MIDALNLTIKQCWKGFFLEWLKLLGFTQSECLSTNTHSSAQEYCFVSVVLSMGKKIVKLKCLYMCLMYVELLMNFSCKCVFVSEHVFLIFFFFLLHHPLFAGREGRLRKQLHDIGLCFISCHVMYFCLIFLSNTILIAFECCDQWDSLSDFVAIFCGDT